MYDVGSEKGTIFFSVETNNELQNSLSKAFHLRHVPSKPVRDWLIYHDRFHSPIKATLRSFIVSDRFHNVMLRAWLELFEANHLSIEFLIISKITIL